LASNPDIWREGERQVAHAHDHGLWKAYDQAYGIAVIIVFAILNGIFWLVGNPRLHDLNVFSAGFILGMLGMYIAAWLYGYRRVAID
jgi:hypothetical protein